MRITVSVSIILICTLCISLFGGIVLGNTIFPYPTDPTTGESTDVYTEGINLHDRDTSGNGISDYDELFVYGTNPLLKDTTRDGLSDYDEIMEYETDPTKIDSNGDGVSDAIQILNYGSDPLLEDTTRDGVSDKTYIEYNLNPSETHYLSESYEQISSHSSITLQHPFEGYSRDDNVGPDSTNDRFSDAISEEIPVLDPEAQNIVVTIEYMESVDVNVATLLSVRESFADSPGEDMNLIYYINSNPVEYTETITDTEYENEYYPERSSTHHLLFSGEAELEGDSVGGFAIRDGFGMVVGDTRYGYQSGVVMHEIGHSIGLMPEAFDGIDSREYSVEEYNSILNYTYMDEVCGGSQTVCTGFSSSGEFNDWEYIQQNLANNNPQIR